MFIIGMSLVGLLSANAATLHGQVTIGEPSTGIVIAMNGAQDQQQAPRTVFMTFFSVLPTLLDAVSGQNK